MMRLLLWALMIVLVVVYFGTDPKHALKGLTADSQSIYRHVDDNGVVSYTTVPQAEQNSAPAEVPQSSAKATRKVVPSLAPKMAPSLTLEPKTGSAKPR
jgi:hypothetical protein